MVSFRNLFTFTKQEVDAAFQGAIAKKYGQGLKLLEAPSYSTYGKLLIVTPRACGKAHDRNLIKRRLKAIFHTEKLYTTPALWIMLIRKQSMTLNFTQLKEFLLNAMKLK